MPNTNGVQREFRTSCTLISNPKIAMSVIGYMLKEEVEKYHRALEGCF